MKTKPNLIMTQVEDDYILVPVGDTKVSFNGLVRLNTTGAEIWRALEEELSEEEIVNRLKTLYTDVDHNTLVKSVRKTIDQFKDAGLLE